MSFVSNFTDPNTMNSDKLAQVKESYAELIVDGMDMNSLVTFAVETIVHNMEMWDEQDLKEEVLDLYDEEIWNDLLEEWTYRTAPDP